MLEVIDINFLNVIILTGRDQSRIYNPLLYAYGVPYLSIQEMLKILVKIAPLPT